ncbi:MAG: Rieske 2Fe-2S domain-containing protein [Sandaracinus sp.]
MSPPQVREPARPLSPPAPARFGALGIPIGWYVVAFSSDLPAGEVRTLRYFGRELVAFRGASGRVTVAGAYCPHLGAHLGCGGVVEGDAIRCPFHKWRFDGSGECREIPYSDVIPRTARLETLPVLEQNGVVHAFFDPTGTRAPWSLPVLDESGWTPGRTVIWRGLTTHPQEIFENTVDVAHIGPIHDGRGARLRGKPEMDGERMRVEVEFEAPGAVVGMPDLVNDVHLEVTLRGLGWVVVQTHVRNVEVRARQRIYVTPVDEEHFDIRGIVHVREGDDPAFTEELAELFHRAYVEDFAKDFPIWENKRYLARPQLAKGDGPIGGYRHWCTQFHTTRAAGERPAPARDEAPPASPAEPATARRPDVPLARLWSGVREAVARWRQQRPAPDPLDPASVEAERSSPRPASTPAPTASRPVRDAAEYFDTLAERFVPSAARGVDAVFQWELGGEGGRTFHARVHEGALEIVPGAHPAPNVALVIDARSYVRVVNGELDGTRAFTTGGGKVRGSLPLAMKMRALFPA